jgi:cathepsin L
MLALIISLLLVSALATEDAEHICQQQWSNFKVAFGKNYGSDDEHDNRYAVFKSNHKFITEFPTDRGFTVGHNEFSDMTNAEFRARFNGLNISANPSKDKKSTRFTVNKAAPADWDWRKEGAVTGVKNQGQCGSCWSFSSTGSMEGAWFITKRKLVSLSEQNLIDCSVSFGNEGCNGGLMDQAFKYVISNHGVDTEASYPYQTAGPLTCRFKSSNVGATISNYKDVPQGSETQLLADTYERPVSVAIDASHRSFQFYNGGVYNEPACSSYQLDHGVLSVGYGVYEGKTDYWLVKNSWGTSWGLNGYIMMSRNKKNQCGIATAASFPIV